MSRHPPLTHGMGMDRWHAEPGPFDAWLRRGLADAYGAVTDEAVPEELRLLVNRIAEC